MSEPLSREQVAYYEDVTNIVISEVLGVIVGFLGYGHAISGIQTPAGAEIAINVTPAFNEGIALLALGLTICAFGLGVADRV